MTRSSASTGTRSLAPLRTSPATNKNHANDTMKLLELIMVLALGALIAGAMLYGLELSDAAQDKQQATWHIAN